jgi:hypothetical protein
MQCWQDIAQFQQFLLAMLSQAGPVPLQGVTDGSIAKAGYIGETMFTTVQGTFPNTANFTQNISALVLPPGDWDISVFVQLVAAYTSGTYFYLNPLPAGIANDMRCVTGAVNTSIGADLVDQSMTGPVAQANVTVPTLLAFTMVTNYAGATTQPAGTFYWQTYARRMR